MPLEPPLNEWAAGFARVAPMASTEAQALLDLALLGVQALQSQDGQMKLVTVLSPVDLHERCVLLATLAFNEDLADRLQEAAQVFLLLARRAQGPSTGKPLAAAPMACSTEAMIAPADVSKIEERQCVTYAVGCGSLKAMWSYAARVELALTLARKRSFTVSDPPLRLDVAQVAHLATVTQEATHSVATQIRFIPRFLLEVHLRDARDLVEQAMPPLQRRWARLTRWRWEQQMDALVEQTHQAILQHVANSLLGLKEVPDAADHPRSAV